MDLHLIEPYNPYCRTHRKKHPMEIAEEEAIYYRIIQESLKKKQTELENTYGPVGTCGGPGILLISRTYGSMNNTFGSINLTFNQI